MDGLEWIGAVMAAVAGGGGVMYYAMKHFSSHENDGSDGHGD